MMIIGIGCGIFYVGILRLLQFFVEYSDITARSVQVEERVVYMAMEAARWIFREAIFLICFGVIIILLGIWYKRENKILQREGRK